MAGVVFVLKFLELFGVFPHEDLGFSEDAGLEVGIDDASLTFGCGLAVKRSSQREPSTESKRRRCHSHMTIWSRR